MPCLIELPPGFVADVAKTLLGTFFGAGLALGTALWLQARQRNRDHLVAGNVALFTLARQFNDYINVRSGFMKAQQEAGASAEAPAWLRYRPMKYTFNSDLKIDTNALGFLFDTGDGEAVRLAAWAELRYHDLTNAVQRFNEVSAELQKAMIRIGIRSGVPFDVGEAEAALPVDAIANNTAAAEALRESFEKDEPEYVAALRTLRRVLVGRFGERLVINPGRKKPLGAASPA